MGNHWGAKHLPDFELNAVGQKKPGLALLRRV